MTNPMTVNIHIDPTGFTVLKPNLHDGRLVGLLTSDGEARLFLSNSAGKPYTLVLSGVERVRADGFLEANIILDIAVIPGDRIPTAWLEGLFSISISNPKTQPFWENLHDRIRRDGMVGVELNPSYGCSLRALCMSITALSSHVS